jgi:hypothetical protein
MADTGTPPAEEMPTPDMTSPTKQPEPSLSPAERQKLELFRQEHPQADAATQVGSEGEMPRKGMND